MNICIPIVDADNFTININYKIVKLSLIFNTENYFFQIINMEGWTYNQMIEYLQSANVHYFMSNGILVEDVEILQSKRINIYPLDYNLNALDNAGKLKQYIDENKKYDIRPQTHG